MKKSIYLLSLICLVSFSCKTTKNATAQKTPAQKSNEAVVKETPAPKVANPALADKNGVTALHLIAQKGSKETLEEALKTVNKEAIHALDNKSQTPLDYANKSKKNAAEKVKLLKESYTHKPISNESQSAALRPKHPPHPRINMGPEHPGERGRK